MHLKQKNKNSSTRTIVIDSLKYKSNSVVAPFIFQTLLLYITLVGFLYCVATSVDMTIGLPTICLISFPILLVTVFLSLNKKVFISFLSVFGASILAIAIFAKGLLLKIVDSFVFCYNLTVNIMVEQGYINYESAMTQDITELITDERYMTECFYVVIVTLAVLFSILFSATLLKRSLIWVSAIPCFIVLTPSLYFGSTPSGIAFSIFISGILGCYIEYISKLVKKSKAVKTKNEKENKRDNKAFKYILNTAVSGFSCMCVSLVISLSVSFFVFSSEGFQIESIRKMIDDFAQKITNLLFYENYETADGAIGGLLDGDVLELKTPEFRDLPVMTVTTKTNTSLYLRGWIGDELVDDGWKVLDDKDTKEYNERVDNKFDETTQFYNYIKIVSDDLNSVTSSQDIAKLSPSDTAKMGFVYDNVNVKAKYSKSLMVFTPVRCIDGEIIAKGADVTKTADTITFFTDKRSKNNQYSYEAALQTFSDRSFYLSIDRNLNKYLSLSNVLLNKTGIFTPKQQEMYTFISAERKYSEYVKEKYMSVPENSDMLKEIAQQVTSSYNQDFAKALAIEKYFKTNYTYAKSFTHAAGSAMQKVNYMINETKTGYCTYYATAMTVMMRQLGVPARYVTGYHAITAQDNGNDSFVRNIDDNDYHAWVEVYFEGMGWLTFDPTPGMNTTEQLRDYDYLDDPVPPEEEPPVETPDEDVEPPKQTPPTPPNAVDVTDIPMEVYVDIPLWLIIALFILAILLVIALILLIIVIVIKSIFKNYIDGLRRLQPTQLVKAIYPKIMLLLKSLGNIPKPGEMILDFSKRVDEAFKLPVSFESVLSTLEMSQFSQNDISVEQAAAVFDLFTLIYTNVFYSLNIFKKYYYMLRVTKKIKL